MNDIKKMHYSELMIAYVEALSKNDGFMKMQLEREINKRNKEVEK